MLATLRRVACAQREVMYCLHRYSRGRSERDKTSLRKRGNIELTYLKPVSASDRGTDADDGGARGERGFA